MLVHEDLNDLAARLVQHTHLYVPVEVVEVVRKPSTLGYAVLAINLAVVAVMVWALIQRRRAHASGAASPRLPREGAA
jgi:hypothetical protein